MNPIFASELDRLAINFGSPKMQDSNTAQASAARTRRENLIQAIGLLITNSSLGVGLSRVGSTLFISKC